MKPQDSLSHYKRRGAQGKTHLKPGSDIGKGMECCRSLGHLGKTSQVGWLQKEVAFRRSGRQSVGPAAQGPGSQGPQVDKAGNPVFPLGWAKAGRAQNSENSSAGHPQAMQISAPVQAQGASRPVWTGRLH